MTARYRLGAHSRVVEVASNDGYLLQHFVAAGVPVLGIEPAANVARAAEARGVPTRVDFLGEATGRAIAAEFGAADLVLGNNVLAHVPDINDFVAGFATLLQPTGVATFEFPHLLPLVQQCQFDTLYHEHFSYLSLTAVQRIFAASGLAVFDVQELPTHGGSLRVFAQRSDASTPRPTEPAVAALLAREVQAGVCSADFYSDFQLQALRIKRELLSFLIDAQARGRKVAAYGAAAKGNTLLNFAGVRPDLLPYVVDKNPAKQGKFLPGSRIPIVDEAHLRADRPDVVLILPWNLRDEIMAQLAYVREWGGAAGNGSA